MERKDQTLAHSVLPPGMGGRPFGDVLRSLLRGLWFAIAVPCTLGTMEEIWAQRVREAREAWPGIMVDEAPFLEFVRARVPDDELADAHVDDLYLVCGCVCGLPRALEAFEARYMARVGDFIHRIDSSSTMAEEVKQVLRERLLVAAAGSPGRIAEYAGRGPLMSWLRVVAVRAALELQRSRKPSIAADEDRVDAGGLVEDPELDYLRTRYGSEFRQAFTESLAALDPKQRTILQLYLVDGLNIERIGQVYQVHRATVARWIATTRDGLYDETRRRLRERLHLDAAEFESIVRLVRSQLDVSVRRILQEGTEGEPRQT